VVWVASNITANKRLQQQLQEQTLTDELTGLRNRRGFMRELAQAYTAHRQQGLSACLLSFDVDHFRAINDGWAIPQVIRRCAIWRLP
jgi:GGDEF domain-containing protein